MTLTWFSFSGKIGQDFMGYDRKGRRKVKRSCDFYRVLCQRSAERYCRGSKSEISGKTIISMICHWLRNLLQPQTGSDLTTQTFSVIAGVIKNANFWRCLGKPGLRDDDSNRIKIPGDYDKSRSRQLLFRMSLMKWAPVMKLIDEIMEQVEWQLERRSTSADFTLRWTVVVLMDIPASQQYLTWSFMWQLVGEACDHE